TDKGAAGPRHGDTLSRGFSSAFLRSHAPGRERYRGSFIGFRRIAFPTARGLRAASRPSPIFQAVFIRRARHVRPCSEGFPNHTATGGYDMRNSLRILTSGLLLALWCATAFAQGSQTGGITGVVTDPQGAVVP